MPAAAVRFLDPLDCLYHISDCQSQPWIFLVGPAVTSSSSLYTIGAVGLVLEEEGFCPSEPTGVAVVMVKRTKADFAGWYLPSCLKNLHEWDIYSGPAASPSR